MGMTSGLLTYSVRGDLLRERKREGRRETEREDGKGEKRRETARKRMLVL